MYGGVLRVHGDVRVVVDDVADLGELVLEDANLVRPRRSSFTDWPRRSCTTTRQSQRVRDG